MTATIIPLAHYRTLRTRAYRQPPIRHVPRAPDPAALAITCLLWWSAVLQVTAGQIATVNHQLPTKEPA